MSEFKHSHYHKDVSRYDTIDIYVICDLYVDDNSGCIQHAVKKLLCGGKRGAKDEVKDLQEAMDTIQRKIEILQSMNADNQWSLKTKSTQTMKPHSAS